jgi:uridylate kinase
VDAVYDCDPEKNKNAVPFKSLTYMEVLKKQLRVLDAAAISLCMDNQLPIVIFNIGTKGNLRKVIVEEGVGTLLHAG